MIKLFDTVLSFNPVHFGAIEPRLLKVVVDDLILFKYSVMDSAGRGRGRGRGRGATNLPPSQNTTVGLSKASPIDQLAAMVNSLAIDADVNELTPVTDTTMKLASLPENQETVVNMLYNRCLKDWKFSPVAADICNKVQHTQAGDTKLRDLFLKTIQTDFKDKESMREKSPEKAVGCISLLCQMLSCVRLTNGEVQKILVNPALEGLEMCLDNKSSNLELECAASQLQSLGPIFTKESSPVRLNQLKKTIKDKIINGEGSASTRSLLLDAFEGLVSQWTMNIK